MQSPPPRADSLSPIACLLAGGPPRCWMVIFNRCAPSPLRAAYPPIASVLADVGDGSLGPEAVALELLTTGFKLLFAPRLRHLQRQFDFPLCSMFAEAPARSLLRTSSARSHLGGDNQGGPYHPGCVPPSIP